MSDRKPRTASYSAMLQEQYARREAKLNESPPTPWKPLKAPRGLEADRIAAAHAYHEYKGFTDKLK